MNKTSYPYIKSLTQRILIWCLYVIILSIFAIGLLVLIAQASGNSINLFNQPLIIDKTSQHWNEASLVVLFVFGVGIVFIKSKKLQYFIFTIYTLLILFTTLVGDVYIKYANFEAKTLNFFTPIPYLTVYLTILIMFMYIHTKIPNVEKIKK